MGKRFRDRQIDRPTEARASWDRQGFMTRTYFNGPHGGNKRHQIYREPCETQGLHYHKGTDGIGKVRKGIGSYTPLATKLKAARTRELHEAQQDQYEFLETMQNLENGSVLPHRKREIMEGLKAAGFAHLF